MICRKSASCLSNLQVFLAMSERIYSDMMCFLGVSSQSSNKSASVVKKETPAEAGVVNLLEARPGFEPGIKALQASALPLGHLAI